MKGERKIKRIVFGIMLTLSLIVISLQVFSFKITSYASSETILYGDPSVIRVRVGNDFSMNITVKDVADLFAFDLCLGYNTTVLDALTVIILPPFDRGPIIPPIINDPEGYVRVSGSLLPGEPGRFGSFPIATITFNATSLGNSALHLYNTNLADSTLNTIAHVSVDASVTVYSRIITVPDDYPTIQEAINHAEDEDILFIRNGIYGENFIVNKSLTI